jgi:hypothetical protein
MVALSLGLAVAPPVSAQVLSRANAENECRKRTWQYAASALGVPSPIAYASAFHRYDNTHVAVRTRYAQGYIPTWMRYYNCSIRGVDAPDGFAQNVSFYVAWAAPDANVFLSYPSEVTRYNPFVDPVTGNPW